MELGLRERTVLITGASGYIGRATAIAFGREGCRVAVGYHAGREAAEETVQRVEAVGGVGLAVPLDLSIEESIDTAVEHAHNHLGPIEVLVNNAVAWPGFPEAGELFETTPVDRVRASLTTNLLGYYLMARAVVGSMRARHWGRIVHVSTGLVQDGNPGSTPYVMAKSGLTGLTRTMSRELAPVGILTNVVMAGFVPAGRMPEDRVAAVVSAAATDHACTPEEMADVMVFVCSQANQQITGETIRADGHFLTPRRS